MRETNITVNITLSYIIKLILNFYLYFTYNILGVIIKLLITSMDETGKLHQHYTPPYIKIIHTST